MRECGSFRTVPLTGVGERVVIVNGLEMARNVFSPSSFLSIGEEGVSFWIREERGKGCVD